jgi:alcohol dehydrogenase (cytochrome c)
MTFKNRLRAGSARLLPATVGLAAVFGLGAGGALAQSTALTPTTQEFVNAASDTANWILPAKSYSGNHYTGAAQITPANVEGLHLAWSFQVSDRGPMEVSPIVYNGTMYVTSAHDHVYALDAATGKLKWEFKNSPHVISFAANRGIALLDGNVYIGTLDGHLIALNAATGEKVWDKVTVDDTANSFYTMAPVPYHNPATNQDVLLMGVSNGDWGGIGNIAAYDPKDGHEVWRWQTVPGPGEPGHDTWSGDSWKRGGASTWGGVTIDTASQTMYLDLGNPGPDFLATARQGDNLYSDSMVALDLSGAKPKLKWHYQFIPHDEHDWDPPMQPVLFTGKVGGDQRKLVAAGDKAGNFWILDAESGKLVDKTITSFQKNVNVPPSIEGNIACPNTLGGIEYQGGAFDPATNAFYIPSQNECGSWTASKDAVYIAGQFYLGGGFPTLVGPNTAQMNAIDVSTGVFNWRHHFDLPNYGGGLVTASGLLFSGDLAGNERAFDTKTGHVLWTYDTGSYIQAPSEVYETNGKEYLVVASGTAGNAEIPELPNPAGQAAVISAFTLK